MKKISLLLLFFAISLLQAQVPQSERDALVALYNATDGPNWTYTDNWNTSNPVNTWTGVTVENINGQDHVTKIELKRKNLTGSIPSEIGNFPYLTVLNIGNNHLSGTIPTEIGNLTNLMFLRLSFNNLSGTIPTEISNLTNLNYLSLAFNNLSGAIPASFGSFTSLEYLFFSSNKLSGTIPDFSSNLNLQYLYVYENDFQFADLEPNFNAIFSLIQTNNGYFIYAPMNKLDTELSIDMVPGNTYTFNMPTISGTGVTYQWYLNDIAIPGATNPTYTINNAQNSDLGDYICKASSPVITDLTIERNVIHLYGTILQSDKDVLLALYNATDGSNWTHHDNWNTNAKVHNWYGIKMRGNRVIEIKLDNNNLNGTIPASIGDLSELIDLNLSNNYGLNGNIPTEIGNLSNLENLWLFSDNISGNIPTEIGNLSNLKVLYLWFNQLTGNIPTQIGNLTNLEALGIDYNNLTGNIPASLTNLTKLKEFWISHNQLTGDIPSGLFNNMPDLVYVATYENDFTGELDLSHNPKLYGIWTNDTQISTLDIRNGHNNNIQSFRANNNPNLTCIFVDDKTYATNTWTDIDPTAHFVETQAECDALHQERDALIALYNATDGPNWTNKDNWNTNQPIGTWYGVTVENINGDEHVTKIILPNNNLTGNLPSEIGNLPYLREFFVYSNILSGTLPASISSLTHLENIHLEYNHLSGTFPDLSNNPNLKFLSIYYNDFQFADLEPNFNAINTLIQSNNGDFRYIPMNPIDTELSYDMVTGNNYTFNMPTVNGTGVTYQWYRNDTEIPGATSQTYTITNAQHSDLGDYTCKASSHVIPDLTIDRNVIHLYGPVIQSDKNALMAFYYATNGANWNHNDNWNTSAPVYNWYGVKVQGDRVSQLNFYSNNLNGYIPAEIGDLTALKRIFLYRNNQLSGNLPVEIGNLTNLETLIIGYCNLTGNIPHEIGNINALKYLYLKHNQLSGSIPIEIGNLTNLTYLNLKYNQLSGNIPHEIGNLSNLERLYLDNNQLTGSIPAEIGNLSNLTYAGLRNNQLSNSIPTEIGNLSNLEYLYLYNNQLSGNIPHEIGNLSNLKTLNLSNNQLTGNIPSEIGNLSNLYTLACDHNTLTGTIPANFSNLPHLSSLYVENNQLSGDISSSFENLNKLTYIDLSHNSFTGDVNLSNNTQLVSVRLENLQISTIDIQNGHNANITTFYAGSNPNLTCIYVDDKNANYLSNWQIDPTAHFVETQADCNYYSQTTYVPDDNFENYLETHDAQGNTVAVGDANSLGNGIANDDYVFTSRVSNVTSLDVHQQNISDLTGISDFVAIESLNCKDNQLTSLDVTLNVNLRYLNFWNNQLTNIDLSHNPELRSLICYDNQLTNIDLSHNPYLYYLACDGNQLTGLNLTQNLNLQFLTCKNNQLTYLNLPQTSTLQFVNCSTNQLTNIDVTHNSNIYYLGCGGNQLTSIDVTQNTALEQFYCSGNQLTSIDLTQNSLLQSLECNSNNLVNLDVSLNSALTYFICSYNQLTTLDLRNGNNANLTNFIAYNNPNLTCVFVDNANYMNTNWPNAIDATATYVETQADCDALSIDESFKTEIQVYPNPFTDTITIEATDTSNIINVSIQNMQAQIVYKGDYTGQINLKNLPAGMYLLNIEGQRGNKAVFKLIKK